MFTKQFYLREHSNQVRLRSLGNCPKQIPSGFSHLFLYILILYPPLSKSVDASPCSVQHYGVLQSAHRATAEGERVQQAHTSWAVPLVLQPQWLPFLFLFFILLFSLLHIGFKQKDWILPFSQAITSKCFYTST